MQNSAGSRPSPPPAIPERPRAACSLGLLASFPKVIGPLPAAPFGDEAVDARNAKVAAFKASLLGDARCLGAIVAGATPCTAALYAAMGLDWVWLEWQHAPNEFGAFASCVAACEQRGALSVVRVAGTHDKTGMQQALDAGVDILLVNDKAECEAAVRHCAFAPAGDRVYNGSPFCARKRTQIMFQLETSQMIDHLDAICTMHPRDGLRLHRAGRPVDVDGAAHARLDAQVRAGRRAQVVLRLHRDDAAQARQGRRRLHARRRPVDAAPRGLLDGGARQRHLRPDERRAASIMTGGLILQPKPTEPGLERLKGWTRAFSKLNPTPKFLLSEMVPTLARHMWTVKGPSAPKDALLRLPAVMPPDVSKVADMEKDPMLEAVAK